MRKRVLALTLVLALAAPFPVWGAEEAAGAYERAVEELRSSAHYNRSSERTYETDDCTIFVYDNGGVMRAPHNRIVIIYKAGSKPGEGARLEGAYPYAEMLIHGPDRLELSEDRKTLTYAYLLEEDEDAVSLKAGIYTYTVDLPTGITTPSYAPLSYAGMADVLANGADYTLEKRLDGLLGSAILRWSDCISPDEQGNDIRDYELYLVCREGEPTSQRLILPSTVNTNTAYSPTHQPPDSMGFSEDGKSFTYVYSFDAALKRGDTLLHDAGTYTYTVDLASGELSVSHEKETAPALEGEGTTFVDVSPEDWFAPYVEVCVEEGLMKGVGGGRFDPQGTVTMAEAATLAARIHHLKNGGDGNLPHAPEEWGRFTLTFEDGERYSFYSSRNWGEEDGWYRGGRTGGLLYFTRNDGWDGRDYQRVTLKGWSSDITLQGQAEVPNNVGTSLRFSPDPWDGSFYDFIDAPQTPPSQWYRDTDYYLLTNELGFYCADYAAQRSNLVSALDTVVGEELTPINHITDYPDAYDKEERERVLRFYNAGILTGTDGVGSFSPSGYLTRAEMAAMAARILRPELRVEFSLQKPEFQPYTLIPLEFSEEIDFYYRNYLTADLLRFYRHDEEGNWTGEAILRADGTVLDLPEGSSLYQYPSPNSDQLYPLLVLSRTDLTMPSGSAYGVMDPLTGEMVLPFGPYSGTGICAVVGDGRHFLTKEAAWDNETWTPTLLRDDKGSVIRGDLPETEELRPSDWCALGENGLIPAFDGSLERWGYRNMEGEWAIQPQYGWVSNFSDDRAIVSLYAGYGVIDSQGREVIPCVHGHLERYGKELYKANAFSGEGYWLWEGGEPFKNAYLNHSVYLNNGYFALGNRYLDENFQYATPAIFDWTGPINAQGSGFVGMDGKIYRIQFGQ